MGRRKKKSLIQQCSVPGCERQFVPGKSGVRGMCRMHYDRHRKGSPLANVPTLVRTGEFSEVIRIHVSPRLKGHLERKAGEAKQSFSAYSREILERASQFNAAGGSAIRVKGE